MKYMSEENEQWVAEDLANCLPSEPLGRSSELVGHSCPLLWTCDECGGHPYRPERERLIGMGCVCGGIYRRLFAYAPDQRPGQ
jgi:hypothetical protein